MDNEKSSQKKVKRNVIKEKQLQHPGIFDDETLMLLELYADDLGLEVMSTNDFPSLDMFHAHCEITVPVEKSCSDAYTELKGLTDESKDTAEPPGSYRPKEHSDHSYVWTERTTANGKYTDDVIFEFK